MIPGVVPPVRIKVPRVATLSSTGEVTRANRQLEEVQYADKGLWCHYVATNGYPETHALYKQTGNVAALYAVAREQGTSVGN